MLDTYEISKYFKPLAPGLKEVSPKLGIPGLRKLQHEANSELQEQTELFKRLRSDIAAWNADPEDLVQIASSVESKELEDKALLDTAMTQLQSISTNDNEFDAETRTLIYACIIVFVCWLALHSEVSDAILKLAAERKASGNGAGALRAQPLEGEIDHEALSREFMARFPKLRAALAK